MSEKVKVKCEWCERKVGTRVKGTYDVNEGTIQEGQGKGEQYLSFCSRTCQKKYHLFERRLKDVEMRVEDLERKAFERKVEILNSQGDLHPEFKKYLKEIPQEQIITRSSNGKSVSLGLEKKQGCGSPICKLHRLTRRQEQVGICGSNGMLCSDCRREMKDE